MANTTTTNVGVTFSVANQMAGGIASIERDLQGLADTFNRVAGLFGVGFSLYSMTKEIGSWIDAAKEADKVQRTFNLVLGDSAQAAGDWAEHYNKAIGASKTETEKFLTTFNMLATELGATPQQALQVSESMTRLSRDISSFSHGTITADEAAQKLLMSLQGNSRGLKELGITISATAAQEYALRHGWIQQGEVMSDQQKLIAEVDVLFERTVQIQGDVERSAGSAADAERRLKTEWQDLKVELGKEFTPAYHEFLNQLHEDLKQDKQDLVNFVEGLAIAAESLEKIAAKITHRGTQLGSVFGNIANLFPEERATYNPNPLMNAPQALPEKVLQDRMDRMVAQIQGTSGLGAPALPGPTADEMTQYLLGHGPHFGGSVNYHYPGPNTEPALPWTWSAAAHAGPIQTYSQPGPSLIPTLAEQQALDLAQSGYAPMTDPGGETKVKAAADKEAKEQIRASRELANSLKQTDDEYFTAKFQWLEDEKAKYQDLKIDENVIDKWYYEQDRKLQIQQAEASDNFFAGFKAGVTQMHDEMLTMGQMGAQAAKTFEDSWVNASDQVLFEGGKISDMFRTIALDMSKMLFNAAEKNVLTTIMGGATNILGSWLGGGGPTLGSAGVTGPHVMHGGGIIGSDSTPFRLVDSSVFAHAPRAHSGLLPGEQPIIARPGEGVFTPGQMRAIGARINSAGSGSARTETLLAQILQEIHETNNRPVTIDAESVWSDQIQRDRRRRGPLTRGY